MGFVHSLTAAGVDPAAVYTTSGDSHDAEDDLARSCKDVYARGPDNGWTLSPSGSGPETLWAELNNPFPLVWEAVTTGGPITPARAVPKSPSCSAPSTPTGCGSRSLVLARRIQPGDVLQF